MLQFITHSGKWFADIISTAVNVEWVSAYVQNIKILLPSLEKLKLGPIRSTFKFFFTTEQLPQRVNRLTPIYAKIRRVAVTVGRPVKSVVMSKKTSAALAALGTAASLAATSAASLPIIIVGSVFAAWSTSRAEMRRQTNDALAKRIAALEKAEDVQFHCLDQSYGDQQFTSVSFTDKAGKRQVIEEEELKKYYGKPSPIEIVKMGLDVALAGIVGGAASLRVASTVASYAYSLYSGHQESKAVTQGAHTLREKLRRESAERNKGVRS